MADPLSITGLILQVSQTLSSLINYAQTVHSARSDIQKLSEELFALKGILDHLAAQIKSKPPPYDSDAQSLPFNTEILTRALQPTNEFLQSLLKDLEEPATKFGKLKQKLEWPFTQEQFNAHLLRLERVKSWLILVLMTDNVALSKDMHTEIDSLAHSVKKDLSILHQERLQKADRELLHWLAPVNPANTHLRASPDREIGTGTWFIDGWLKDWLHRNNEHEKILFLRAGAGKTTLFAHAVDELTSMSSYTNNLCVAYFYCSFGDVASQDPANILGSLVAQLSSMMPSILDAIRLLYEKTLKKQTHRPPIDITALEDAITRSSDKARVVLLIDAINESSHADRIERSLLGLADLCTNLRIFVTSTEDMISTRHVSIMNLDAQTIQRDIAAFINHRIEQDKSLSKVNAKLKDEIRKTLLHDADGSFRWVQLSLDNLSSQRTAKSIYQSLHTLPGTLRETYGNVLERIPPSDWKYVREALLWLTFAKRPLSLDELNEAVVHDDTSTMLDDDMKLVSPHLLLQICQGLITQDRSGMVNLAHASIKDFLTSEWIRSSKVHYFSLNSASADKTLMWRCLAYLSLENFQSGYTAHDSEIDLRLKAYPFLNYATNFWVRHAAVYQFNDRDRELVMRFFDTKNLPQRGNFGTWVQVLMPNMTTANIQTTDPLYYAASFGLEPVIKAILASDPGINIDAPGGRHGSTPLFVACWRHQYQAEVLLEAGADPHIKDRSTGYTVFSLAKARGIQPFEALLVKYADRKGGGHVKPAVRSTG